jgi:hypothetical protein
MVWFVFACIVQALAGVFYLFAGLIVPPYGVVFLWAIWIAATILLVRFRHRGPVIWVIPAVTVSLWFVVIWIGESWLGWTA